MNAAATESFTVLQAPGGVEVHLLRTDRTKTTLLFWVAERPLDGRRAAFALLVDLLVRGTRRSPGMAEWAARTEELFATELLSSASGHGSRQLIRLGFETIADRYGRGRPVLDEAVGLLAEVLRDPPLVDGRFRADHVEQERANLVHDIEGLSDDKSLLAYRRMVEHLHAGTPRALHSWGTVDEARALEEADAYAAWDELREHLPARLFLVGDVEPEQALAAAERLSGGVDRPPPPGVIDPPAPVEREVHHLVEQQPLAQSKLVLGFRLPPQLLMGHGAPLYAMALGGDAHSRLFKRVREAEGLAYGCSAQVSIENAMLVVQAGIDADKAGRVEELVLEEIARLAEEGVGPEELALSRRALERGLLDLHDAPRDQCGFRLRALLNGRPATPDEALASLQAAGAEDIRTVAAACRLDTVFLLEGTSR